MVVQRRGKRFRIRFTGWLDHRVDDLSEILVGHAYDPGIGHVRAADQYCLNLSRVDVDASAQDEVAAAVRDVQVPVGVKPAEIADRDVAIVAGSFGLGRIVPILKAAAAPEEYTSDLARRNRPVFVVQDLLTRARPAAPDAALMGEPLVGADRGAAAFGGRVVLVYRRPEPVQHPALEPDRAGRGSMEHPPQ
jgi:hypothetical protein